MSTFMAHNLFNTSALALDSKVYRCARGCVRRRVGACRGVRVDAEACGCVQRHIGACRGVWVRAEACGWCECEGGIAGVCMCLCKWEKALVWVWVWEEEGGSRLGALPA